ncbi:SpaA isopeptide-forming pilin-related protein [Bifidobacterium eulemuris]|uniref:PA14 domain-containing protein n=1 Tax=Bifidobacterium eulemuris TaxID=1765219 RepID=A0A261G3P8_9BIFI|nr:FctA domain-containing protein [Bifidobacterium eulemuris]OZG66018.1 hypothetical protein BEUL_1916 [Bifidobacterium eulemuris]QOL32071.1 hypothetical protein BE0216_06045 [Bifidobacterium eulemuris]
MPDYGYANFWTGNSTRENLDDPPYINGESDKQGQNADSWKYERGGPRKGIVSSTLNDEGYPNLTGIANNKTSETTGIDDYVMFRDKAEKNWLSGEVSSSTESLQYLFDTSRTTTDEDGMKAYGNVGNLLQVDSQGYYYYDSKKNFASYNEETNKFDLYTEGAITSGGTGVMSGTQFFPFNTASQVFDIDENGELVQKTNLALSNSSTWNHHFGLTMSTRFIQPTGGTVGGNNMTYEFAGDDDVWIYIDGVLVADLGGIHDPVGVTIDFKTGTITYGNALNKDGSFKEGRKTVEFLDEAFGVGSSTDDWQEVGGSSSHYTFADGTYHTLKVFYLERGAQDSNLALKFNLVTVPQSKITKVDQSGNAISGVGFELYGVDANNERHEVASGETDSNGELLLMDPNKPNRPLSFDGIYQDTSYTNYVLKEIKIPDGYRAVGEMQLNYHPPEEGSQFGGYITSETADYNIWKTGAYANAGVLVTAPDVIYKIGNSSTEAGGKIDSSAIAQGTLFAVVLKYTGDGVDGLTQSDNWSVISGTALDGYQTTPIKGIGDVANAAKNGAAYKFTVSSMGAYQANITELPGDIKKYYSLLADSERGNTEYTVAYYFTSAKQLEDADATNTSRLYIESKKDGEKWVRQFSLNLNVPNVKNRLFVQKTDENWDPLTNLGESLTATFNLYKEDDVENPYSDNPTIKAGAQPYDTATTTSDLRVSDLNGADSSKVLLHSAAVFPSTSSGILENGTYYLQESTDLDDSYKWTKRLVKVIVTNQGVYADARDENDEFRVRKGVGSLIRTLVEYAAPNQIDRTLTDITATLQTLPSSETPSDSTDWTKSETSQDLRLNLTYDAEPGHAVLQYRPIGESVTGDLDFKSVTLENDIGWSNLMIRQLYQNDDLGVSGANKQDLNDTVLDNLFSGTTTVMVKNEPKPDRNTATSLDVKKIVSGESGWEEGEFVFEITATGVTATSSDNKTYDFSDRVLLLPEGDNVSCDRSKRTCRVTVTKPETGNSNIASFGEFKFSYGAFKINNAWYNQMDFTYTIREIHPADEDSIKGMTYSQAEYTYTVRAERYQKNGWHVSATPSLVRTVNDAGVAVNEPVDPETRTDGDQEISVHVAAFTNSFEQASLSLPFTGGTTGRQWLLWGLALVGASVLVWLAYRAWCRRNSWSNLTV